MTRAFGIAVLFSTAVLITGCSPAVQPQVKGGAVDQDTAPAEVYHRSYLMDRDFFDASMDGSPHDLPENTAAVIVPHHLLAKYLIGDVFQGFPKTFQPDVVVLIGPNHFGVGNSSVITTPGTWVTPYGDLSGAASDIEALAESHTVSVDERVFSGEHSISGLVPFIKKQFPDASLLPLVLHDRTPEADTQALAEALHAVMPADALVVASLDFSHEAPAPVARERDAQSIEALKTLDASRLDDITVDSLPTLRTLYHYVGLRDADTAVILDNSNAGEVVGDETLPDVTSYITMYIY